MCYFDDDEPAHGKLKIVWLASPPEILRHSLFDIGLSTLSDKCCIINKLVNFVVEMCYLSQQMMCYIQTKSLDH